VFCQTYGGGSRFLTTHQHILGYTVSFTLYDLHTMDSRQLKMTDNRLKKLSTTHKKETTQNTAQQNYPGSVAFYHTRPGNEVGLFYSSRAHTGPDIWQRRAVRTCAAAVSNLSTAAELGNVELIFMNANGLESRMSTECSFNPK